MDLYLALDSEKIFDVESTRRPRPAHLQRFLEGA